MVVLAVAILSRAGKMLMSRQFIEMPRLRIEGLIAAFPKLLGSGKKQHTVLETDSVRYVYQCLDQMYLLLITNKGSNIIADLDTLRLFSKIVPDTCQGTSEDRVLDSAFELIFAFDEVIYRVRIVAIPPPPHTRHQWECVVSGAVAPGSAAAPTCAARPVAAAAAPLPPLLTPHPSLLITPLPRPLPSRCRRVVTRRRSRCTTFAQTWRWTRTTRSCMI